MKAELLWARRLCNRRGWPVIDVTRRSIEETAATVLQLMEAWHDAQAPGAQQAAGTVIQAARRAGPGQRIGRAGGRAEGGRSAFAVGRPRVDEAAVKAACARKGLTPAETALRWPG